MSLKNASQPQVLVDGLAFTECPRWHEGRLWFSDILGGKVMVVDVDGGNLEEIADLPTVSGVSDAWPTGLGWDFEGRLLIVSMKDCRLFRETKAGSRHFEVLADLSNVYSHHCNDMVVDSAGRAYVGGYSFDVIKGEEPSPSEVVLVDTDGTVRVVADGVMMPNGMVLLGDGETLVVAESRGGCLTAFSVDGRDGSLSNKRRFASLASSPDGICGDAEGSIWVSSPSTNEFLRIRDGGEVAERVSTGDHRAMACVLGGVDRRTLFMCTNLPTPPGGTQADMAGRAMIEFVEVNVPGAGIP
jgi:sugar lactone lactonase YvrE